MLGPCESKTPNRLGAFHLLLALGARAREGVLSIVIRETTKYLAPTTLQSTQCFKGTRRVNDGV